MPNPHDCRRLAAAAAVHPVTVGRAYRGEPTRASLHARIVEAARSLAMQLPPSHVGSAARTNAS